MPDAGTSLSGAKRRLIGRTLRFATLVLITSLIIRAFFLESFTVTTGSMAPLLLGIHRQCDCPKCGFPVVVGAPPADVDLKLHWQVKCPNCGQGDLGLENQPDRPGQWLLVDKNVYEWRSPRRWELVVFRGPNGTPYVKRVVGLPGENVQIKDGDVYINGEIARKPFDVASEMGVLLFDGRHFNPNWWALDPNGKPTASGLQVLSSGAKSHWHMQLPSHWSSKTFTDYWVYNGQRVNVIEPAFDFRFQCRVRMKGPAGTCMSIRLENGRGSQGESIQVDLPSTVSTSSVVKTTEGPMEYDYPRLVELTYVDGNYIIRFDNGRPNLRFTELADFKKQPVEAPVRMSVLNADVDFQDMRLYRDTHYQSVGRHGIKTPCRLGPDEFFVLGDNSAVSDDSRMWPEPGVKQSALIGRPIR